MLYKYPYGYIPVDNDDLQVGWVVRPAVKIYEDEVINSKALSIVYAIVEIQGVKCAAVSFCRYDAHLELFPFDELIVMTVFDSTYKEIEEYQKERLKLSVPIREKLKSVVSVEKE